MQSVLPHPRAALLWRLCLVVVGTQLLLTLSMAALNPQFANQSQAATIGAAVWVVFAASLLLMLPFLSRTQTLMREFSLLPPSARWPPLSTCCSWPCCRSANSRH